ncbi:hypothetical protein ACLOJK_036518 [Asimina triloba]
MEGYIGVNRESAASFLKSVAVGEDRIRASGNNAVEDDKGDPRVVKRGVDPSLGMVKRALIAGEGAREREGCAALRLAQRQGRSIVG